jgi:DNA-3-methyladenine glycosylase II
LTHAALELGVRALAQRDPVLADLVRRHGPPPLWARRPGFATLVQIILEQQVSLAAARTIYRRLCGELGGSTPDRVAAGGVPRLRALGLTRQKAAYVHGLAMAALDGSFDSGAIARAPEAEARQALIALPGIGPWTVDIYFLMALRRPDVWPQGDLALAEAMHRVYQLSRRPDAEEQRARAGLWAPWRSVAARMLWQSYLATPRPRRTRDASAP